MEDNSIIQIIQELNSIEKFIPIMNAVLELITKELMKPRKQGLITSSNPNLEKDQTYFYFLLSY